MAEKVIRKRATKKVATRRKAPTRATSAPPTEGRNWMPFIAIGIFLVIIGISVGYGFSDQGQIDITQTVNERKVNATPEELETLNTLQVQRPPQNNLPNRGLVPVETDAPPPTAAPSAEPISEQATSTEEVATSSDAVSEEAGTSPETDESEPTTDEAAVEETEVEVQSGEATTTP